MALPTDVIVFSTADWSEANWTNNQRMSLSLAEAGFRVLYIESLGLRQPRVNQRDLRRIGRRLLKSLRGLRRVASDIWVFSPLVIPFHRNALAQRINQVVLVATVNLLKRWLGFRQPIIWAYNPVVHSFQAQFDPALLIYHCVDDFMTVPGIPPAVVAVAEPAIIEAADLVFVTSPTLQAKLAAIAATKVHYFPNVADYHHFAQALNPGSLPGDLATIPQPRIGFIGAIKDYKLDFDLIQTLAQQHRDWHWVLIGDLELADPQALLDRLDDPNIHFLGYRPYDSLPQYLRGFDVAVLPCLLNEYTRSMFPMKFFEYLAAGKPVVGTRLASLTDYEDLYLAADSIQAFEQALRTVLAGDGPSLEAGIEAAKLHTWQSRCQRMITLMQTTWQTKQPSDASVN